MRFNEEEQAQLQTLMAVRGIKEFETDYFDSNLYSKLRIAMYQGLPALEDQRLKFRFCGKRELLGAGRYVIDKHFRNVDTRIPYSDNDGLQTELVALFGPNPKPEQYGGIIDYINNNIQLVEVTAIPICLDTRSSKNGSAITTWFYSSKIMKKEFYEKLPVCLDKIEVFGPCDESSKMIYVHEMSHALLNKNKGSFKNLLNTETLSLFMEKVAAFDLDETGRLLYLTNLSRLLNTKDNLITNDTKTFRNVDPLGILRNRGYIISSLYASALFDIYQKGSNKRKNEIDKAMGEVIMGNQTIEDVFETYEATLEKGTKITEKQIKQYSK